MRVSCGSFLVALALALGPIACSGDDGAPASPGVGGGCPEEIARGCFEDQKGCASGSAEPACFACAVGSRAEPDGTCVPIDGMAWSHDFAEITTAAGGEVAGLCQSWTLGNETDLYVGTVELVQNESSHHSNWTFVPEDSFDGPDGIWPCEDRGYDQLQAALVGGVLYAQSTQSEHEVQRFPPGAAVRIPAHARIIGDVHLLNVSTESVSGHASLTVYAVPPETVTVSLAPLHLTLSGLEIPARSHTRNSAECNIGTEVMRGLRRPLTSSMYYLLPHTHSLATRFFVQIVGGPRDGEALIDLPAYDGESHGRWYDPPIDLTGITGLRFGCEWDNPRTESLRYGIGDQEMCELLAFIDDVAIEGSVRSVEERAPDGEMRVYDGPCDIAALRWDR